MSIRHFFSRMNSRLSTLAYVQRPDISFDLEASLSSYLQLSGTLKHPQLEQADIKIKLQEESLARNIASLVRRDSNKRAAIAANSNLVVTKRIPLSDNIHEDDLESLAWSEARKHFPGLINDLFLDYTVIDEVSKDDETKQRTLLLVAARKKELQLMLDGLSASNFNPTVIDVDYYCLERAFPLIESQLTEYRPEDYTGLFNIDTDAILFIVMHQGKMIFFHRQSYSSTLLAPALAQIFNDEKNKAPLNDETSRLLCTHIQRLQQYFSSEHSGKSISQIAICGRAALLGTIDALLNEQLDVPCVTVNPLKAMKVKGPVPPHIIELGPAFMLNAGLGLRGLLK